MDEATNAQTYRPEEGERGDGREPPQGRNRERGKRSMAAEWRPPENLQGSQVALAKAKPKVRVQFCFEKTERDKQPEAAARPKLHIDDGCMGGGGDIPYDKYLTESEKDNDIIPNYFKKLPDGSTSNRNGIFFYCIMAYLEPDSDPDDSLSSTSSLGESSGSPIVVFNGNFGTAGEISKTFMHELGHCLGLDHPSDNDEFVRKRNDFIPFNELPITTSMYQGKFDYQGFTDDEWENIVFEE